MTSKLSRARSKIPQAMNGTTIVLYVLKRWDCESAAVIPNLRHYLVMNNGEAQIDGGALGMTHGIVNRFFED